MSGDVRTQVIEFVGDVLSAMGLALGVSARELPDSLRVTLEGEGGDVLLHRKGEALDALQHIANTMFRRHLRDDRHIVIDYLDFRKGKDAELQQMARFIGGRVKETGVSQEIGPLNPYARRIVHLTVAEDPQLASESIGDAFLKTVVISLRKG